MRTAGRGGEALDVGELRRQLGQGVSRFSWDIRLVDMVGEAATSSAWKRTTIPAAALVSRSRRSTIEESTWQLQLTFLADELPASVELKQYLCIEIDRVLGPGPGNRWPYFSGIIDAVRTTWAKNQGAIVRTHEVEAFGMLQRTKGYWVDKLKFSMPWSSHSGRLVGIAPRRRWKITAVVGTAGNEKAPAMLTYDIGNQIKISPNADMSAAYTRGDATNGYTISGAGTPPATITYGSNLNPAEPRWIEIPVPERFGVPVNSGVGTFLALPYGREADDLYQTVVAAGGYSAGPPVTLDVKDPTPFKNGNGLLDTTQGEYLTITQLSSGEEITRQINSTDADGTLTLASGVAFADGKNPVEGDLVRLSTTEIYQSWRTDFSGEIVYYTESTQTTRHKRAAFKNLAQAGLAIPTLAKDFAGSASDSVYTTLPRVNSSDPDSRAEEVIKTLLTSLVKLFPAGNVTTAWTGAHAKDFTRTDMDLAEIVKLLKDKTLPPNAYVHDHEDGKISIKPYRQATQPDWTLTHATSLEEGEEPEAITAVVVTIVDAGDARRDENRTPRWVLRTENITNPEVLTDGTLTVKTTWTGSPPSYIKAIFRVPAATPKEAFPTIREIKVTGRGFLTVYTVNDPDGAATTVYPADVSRLPVGTDQNSDATATLTVKGEDLWAAIGGNKPTDLFIVMDEDDTLTGSPVPPIITEIEILVSDLVAWAARLTDDDAADPSADLPPGYGGTAPTGWKPSDDTAFGAIWWQPNPLRRESFRYAPTDHLKRVLALYDTAGTSPATKARANQRHRSALVELPGISQQDARDIAERYLDEYARLSRRYQVVAPLFDAAELGDTVLVQSPPGQTFADGSTEKQLLLWGISEGGAGDDPMATYELVDYS